MDPLSALMGLAFPNGMPMGMPQQQPLQQATMQAEPELPPPVPFYPSARHIERDWAPEKSIDEISLTKIADARRLAEKTGVLTPELGAHLLPMAMVEGWGEGMGVKDTNAFYASRRFQSALDKMGLKEGADYNKTLINGEPHIMPYPKGGNGPALAAVILGEKAKLRGDPSIEGAIKRYNGAGKAIEEEGNPGDLHYTRTPADVNVYWKKVQEAKRMLEHPSNAPFVAAFNARYGK